MLEKLTRRFWRPKEGQVLIETVVALIFMGSVTYAIVNTDIIPGLRLKWEALSSSMQGKWIR